MADLAFDGDLRRIYEVPDLSSFTVDGSGYRIYTPDNINTTDTEIVFTAADLWSRFSDFQFLNNWTTLAFEKTGGAFRFTDVSMNDIFATFDIRLINDWQFVPANYPHNTLILGNLFPNLPENTDFDTSRITSLGVSPRIQFSDSLQVIREQVGSGLSTDEQQRLIKILDILEADEEYTASTAIKRHKDTKAVLVEKDATSGPMTPVNLTESS